MLLVGVDMLCTVCSFDLIAHDRFSWLLWFHFGFCKASCAIWFSVENDAVQNYFPRTFSASFT